MKFFIKILLILCCFIDIVKAQYANIPVKENFDYLSDYNKLYNWEYLFVEKNPQPPFNNILLPIDSTLNNRMGDRYSDVLEALLTMYEAGKEF